jgi:hypothetical protein
MVFSRRDACNQRLIILSDSGMQHYHDNIAGSVAAKRHRPRADHIGLEHLDNLEM